MAPQERFKVSATAWRSQAWVFVTLDGDLAMQIRLAAMGRTSRFGSVRVQAQIGRTRWDTSLFPDRKSGGWLLPLKADVRRMEDIAVGSTVDLTLDI